MTKLGHSTLTVDDEEGRRLHLVWSRSGRTLCVSVSDRNFSELRQVGLRADQIEQLIGFLTDSLEERRARD